MTTTTSRKRNVRQQVGPFDVRLLDKAEARLRSYISIHEQTGCWIACVGGAKTNLMMVDRVYIAGPRWAWIIWCGGVIPANRSVMHSCDEKHCVRLPDYSRHLSSSLRKIARIKQGKGAEPSPRKGESFLKSGWYIPAAFLASFGRVNIYT